MLYKELAPKILLFPSWEVPPTFFDFVESSGTWGLVSDDAGEKDDDGDPVAYFKSFYEGETPEEIIDSYSDFMSDALSEYVLKYDLVEKKPVSLFFKTLEVKKYDIGGWCSSHQNNNDNEDMEDVYCITAFPNSDYEGGEIVFNDFDLSYKPNEGDVIIFPSTYWNESKVSTIKNKYEIMDHIKISTLFLG